MFKKLINLLPLLLFAPLALASSSATISSGQSLINSMHLIPSIGLLILNITLLVAITRQDNFRWKKFVCVVLGTNTFVMTMGLFSLIYILLGY